MVHLIFEGAELSAKSYLLSLVYPILEKRDNTNPNVLDGCYWINADVGVFGAEVGPEMVSKYVEMAEILRNKNVLFEKLYISDAIYQKLYRGVDVSYSFLEARLKELNYKIVLTTFREDEALLQKRLDERLKQYPHYGRIAKPVSFYLQQQELYKTAVKASSLPYLEVDMSDLDPLNAQRVIDWAER